MSISNEIPTVLIELQNRVEEYDLSAIINEMMKGLCETFAADAEMRIGSVALPFDKFDALPIEEKRVAWGDDYNAAKKRVRMVR